MLRRSVAVAACLLAALQMTTLRAGAAEGPTVTTGETGYSPDQVVDMYGAGFVADTTYVVVVVRPDGSSALYESTESGSGEQVCHDPDLSDGSDCTQTVTSDASGAWTNLYQLNGITGEYTINVYSDAYPSDATVLASTTFIDAVSLGLLGTDGLPHTTLAVIEDLGTVPRTILLSVACPAGLRFSGTNWSTGEYVDWSIAYTPGVPATFHNSTLAPLTTFSPSSGHMNASEPSDCIGFTIATSSLTVGQTYVGNLTVTALNVISPTIRATRLFKYNFRFTVTEAPSTTGGKTIGFWRNKNGQAIIGSYSGRNCQSLRAWLNVFNPYRDLTSGNCTGVRNYVTSVIDAASSSGDTMNRMLKAQMLATALSVYFSDPALGGNRIGAPEPIGGLVIDLTRVCRMIGTWSAPSCSGYLQDAGPAFGGASSMAVTGMLTYAASQSNTGGTWWYGNVKATQELAKNAFDAINNSAVFVL